jgi:hypothetical protein
LKGGKNHPAYLVDVFTIPGAFPDTDGSGSALRILVWNNLENPTSTAFDEPQRVLEYLRNPLFGMGSA